MKDDRRASDPFAPQVSLFLPSNSVIIHKQQTTGSGEGNFTRISKICNI